MSFLIPEAYAAVKATAGSTAAPHSQSLNMILMLVLFGAFIYFFLWRPQVKRSKQQRQLIDSIKKDDEVITSGGMLAKVTKVEETFFKLAIAKDTEIIMQKNAVARVLPKGTIKDW
jgi:preprotein translocase subunit YajC